MVHIDAHTDTWGEFFGSKFTHGAPFRLAVEAGLLDPERTIQIGIRGGQNTLDGIEFSRDHGMRVVFMEEFATLGVDRVIEEARKSSATVPRTSRSMWTDSIRCMHRARERLKSAASPRSRHSGFCAVYAA